MPHPDTIRLILVIMAFVCILGLFQRPVWGVVAYLFIMMLRPGLYYPVLGYCRIELIIGVLVLIYSIFSGRLKNLNLSEPITKWVFIVFAVMSVSMLQAFNFETSWGRMNEFVNVFLFFIMIVTLLETDRDVEIFIWSFALITTLLSYEVVYSDMYELNIKVASSKGGRVDYIQSGKGMGGGHVAMASLCVQVIPFLWFIIVSVQNQFKKLVGILFFIICLYCAILTGSRMGFVGLIVFYVCILVLAKKRLLVAGVGGLAIIIMPMISSDGYMEYMSSVFGIFSGGADLSGGSRWLGLRHGIEMMIKRPLLGVGPGCYPVARKAWFGWGLWSHNHYGQLMGDLGFIGLITWFTFLRYYMKGSLDLIKLTVQGAKQFTIFHAIIVATIVRLVMGYGSHTVYIFFWYMVAAIVIVEKRFYNKQIEKSNKIVTKE